MNASAASREMILDRIREAGGKTAGREAAYSGLPRNYERGGKLDIEARLQLMVERLREYDSEVVECTPDELPDAIAAQLERSGRKRFVAAEGLPKEWLTAGYEWKTGGGLETGEVEDADGVVTGAACGVANSGTIVLHHGGREGRRILSLLPDWHLCILYSSQVVETLPEYFGRCDQAPPLVTWISGPSATADIEMTRIKGVHGPRFLAVILVRDHM